DHTTGLEPEDAAIVVTMRATLDRIQGRPEASLARLRALESVRPAPADRGTVRFHVGLIQLELGDVTAALENLDASRSDALAAGDDNLALLAEELSSVATYVQSPSQFVLWPTVPRTALTGLSLPLASAL